MTPAYLIQLQKRDAKTQRQVFEQYSNALYRLAFRYLNDEMEAEDVVTESFIKAFDAVVNCQFEVTAQFESWLKKIVVNEALKILRKQVNFSLLTDLSVGQIPMIDVGFDAHAIAQILEEIKQLPVGYRTVFNLFAIEGFSHNEISKMLNISEGTSKSQLSKAKAILQKRLIALDQDYAQRRMV